VLVARPTLAGVAHLDSRAARLERPARGRLRLLLVGDRPYDPGEVAAAVGVQPLGVLAMDPASADALAGAGGGPRGLARRPLLRSAQPIAATLAALDEPSAPPRRRAPALRPHQPGRASGSMTNGQRVAGGRAPGDSV